MGTGTPDGKGPGASAGRNKSGRFFIKSPANIITSLRFLSAAAMLWTAPFSAAFWLCYLCGGLSDVVDGVVARRLKLQSEPGAKLDSLADLAFAAAIAAVVIIHIKIPAWLWICAALVAALRLAAYRIGYIKYRKITQNGRWYKKYRLPFSNRLKVPAP